MAYAQINGQTEQDLLMMESIAIPLSFVVLIWVFGGLLAAALPLAVGVLAILGSMAVLRFIAYVTDVSIFALNLSVAMGLALAIDYTLLIISRYRDELADGADQDRALVRTMAAGRTVLFSAMTVALSMGAMVLFPMYFLQSFAYAGVAVVTFAAVAAIVVAPAAIVLLGDRLDRSTCAGSPVAPSAGPNRAKARRADLLVPPHEVRYAPLDTNRAHDRRALLVLGRRSSAPSGVSRMTGSLAPSQPLRRSRDRARHHFELTVQLLHMPHSISRRIIPFISASPWLGQDQVAALHVCWRI